MKYVFPAYFTSTFASLYTITVGRTLVSEYRGLNGFIERDDERFRSSTDIKNEYIAVHMDMLIYRNHMRTLWRNLAYVDRSNFSDYDNHMRHVIRDFEDYVDLEDQYHDLMWFYDFMTRLMQHKYNRILSEKAKRVSINNIIIIFHRHLCNDTLSEIMSYL